MMLLACRVSVNRSIATQLITELFNCFISWHHFCPSVVIIWSKARSDLWTCLNSSSLGRFVTGMFCMNILGLYVYEVWSQQGMKVAWWADRRHVCLHNYVVYSFSLYVFLCLPIVVHPHTTLVPLAFAYTDCTSRGPEMCVFLLDSYKNTWVGPFFLCQIESIEPGRQTHRVPCSPRVVLVFSDKCLFSATVFFATTPDKWDHIAGAQSACIRWPHESAGFILFWLLCHHPN